MIINAGISAVIIRDPYRDTLAEEILQEAGIGVRLI